MNNPGDYENLKNKISELEKNLESYKHERKNFSDLKRKYKTLEQKLTTSEKSAKINENRFGNLFEQPAVGICFVSKDGKFIRTNLRCHKITGYTKNELLKLKIGKITHNDDIKSDEKLFKKLLNAEIKTYSKEKRLIKKR